MIGTRARVFQVFLSPKRRLSWLYVGLVSANVLAWGAALWAFRAYPVPLGSCLLAYAFGLRHAVDADHLAAIDNVTRKLMAEGRPPLGVGLFFSLGHSSVVVIVSAVLTASASKIGRIDDMRWIGGLVGAIVSSAFLLAIAVANSALLVDLFCKARGTRQDDVRRADDRQAPGRGLLARLSKPLFGIIGRSWHMFPLGVLFGLGFDTATEIGVIGLSAASASRGLPVWSIMIFPALFTAGMTLVDTIDGVLMVGAYGRAFENPVRGIRYNMVMTALSVTIALGIGGIEALGTIGDHLGWQGSFWRWIASLNDHFGELGLAATAILGLCWLATFIPSRRARSSRRVIAPN